MKKPRLKQLKLPGHENIEMLLFRRKHWFSAFGRIVIVFFAFVVPVVILIFALSTFTLPLTSIILKIVALFLAVYYLVLAFFALNEWLSYYYDSLIATNEEIIQIEQLSLLNRKISEIKFDEVAKIEGTIKGFFASIMVFGDINVERVSGELIQFKYVPNPVEAADKLIDINNEKVKKDGKGIFLLTPHREVRSPKLVTEVKGVPTAKEEMTKFEKNLGIKKKAESKEPTSPAKIIEEKRIARETAKEAAKETAKKIREQNQPGVKPIPEILSDVIVGPSGKTSQEKAQEIAKEVRKLEKKDQVESGYDTVYKEVIAPDKKEKK